MSGTVDISTLGLEVRSDGVVVASDRLKTLSNEGENAERSSTRLTTAFEKLGYSAKGLEKMVLDAAAAFAAWKLAEFIKNVGLLAARYDTLGVVMTVTGKNAAYANMQMLEFQSSLQKTGISAIESRSGLIRMGEAQIDMANAAKLARVAQDAAVVGNINSSEAFERMMTGLATGQSIILHHLGLMTNFEQGYLRAASSLGKTTDELTDTEKAQIRVNEVLRAGIGIQGAYEAAMSTVGKQITSLPRYIQDLMVKIGEMGQGPLFAAVKGLGDSLKYVNNNFEEISDTAKTIGTGGAIIAIGMLASKVESVAYHAHVAQLQTIALRDNTLFDAAAATSAATAHNAEAISLVNTTRARLAAMDAQIADTKAAFWASQVYKERVALDTQLIALEEGRARVVGQLAMAEAGAATTGATLTAATEAEAAAMTAASFAARAMTGIMAGLNTVLALVGGPIGAIAIAIAGVTYEVIKFLEKAEEAQNRLMRLQNQGDFAQTLAKLKEIEDLNRKLEQDKKTPAEVAKENTAQMHEKINKAVKENVELEKQRQALIVAGDNKTASETWSGKVTEWDKVNTKIKDNNNLIQYGMKVNTEMNAALSKQAELRKSMHQEPPKPSATDPEAQARYNKQLSDAQESLSKQLAANQKQRDMATLQQKISILDQEKAAGLKTAEEYLDGKYALERAEMQKELTASNALADQRYEAYLKVSKDPGADRTMQIKAEEEYRKQVGESLKIVEKMDAATRKKSDDNSTLAQERVNTIIQRTNDLYSQQIAALQQVNALRAENAAISASMVGTNSAGEIDNIGSWAENAFAQQKAAYEQRMKLIQDERDANLSAMMDQKRSYEDYVAVKIELDKKAANEAKKNSQATTKITQDSYKAQTAMVGQYAGLASDLFAGLASAQDQSTRKGFENAKALNIAAAVMATASAIMQQLAGPDGWTPMAWARSGVAAALGAIQVAKIASTSFGGGGAVSSSVSGGSFGGGGSSSAGSSIGAPVKSLTETKTEESLRSLAQSATSASLAMSKVADGLTEISQLFETEYSKNTIKSLGTESANTGNPGWMDPMGHMMFGWGNGWYTKDTGISLAMHGGEVSGQNYETRKKDGGWLTSSKTHTNYSDIDGEVQTSLTSYLDRIKSAISNAAVSVGTSTDFARASAVSSNVSTAGKTPEEIAKQMEEFFTAAANSLAKTTKGLEEFAFYGENAFDALIRLSTSLQGVNGMFELTGKTLIASTLSGANAAWKLTDAFGGLDKMTEAVDAYFKSMFTEGEQSALKAMQEQRQVNAAFKEMGTAAPKTNAEFIALVNSIDVTTSKGATLYESLMKVAPAFADLTKYLNDMKKAQMELNGSSLVRILNATGKTDAAKILEMQISQEQELTSARERGLNVAGLVKAQAAEMAQAQIEIAFNAVKTAISKAQEAQQAAYAIQVKAAQEYVSKMSATASTLKSAFENMVGQQGETLQSRKSAQAQIHWYASTGRLPTDGALDNAIRSVTQPSDKMFGDYTAYRRDYLKTLADINTLNNRAQGQLTEAQKQLKAVETANEIATKGFAAQLAKAQSQIDAIHGTTTAVQSVTASMANLARVIQASRPAMDTSKTDKEIASLRADLRAANTESVAAQKKMAKILERWEDDGMPETRAA